MATKTITKSGGLRAFGAVSAPAPTNTTAPQKPSGAEVIPFSKIDPSTFRLGPQIESKIDSFCKITTESGAPVRLTTGILPKISFTPFGAGPTKDKDGNELNGAWRMAFEIEDEDVAGLDRFGDWLQKETMPNASKLLPGKNDKPIKYNSETLGDKFNKMYRARDDEKGYKALFTAGLQHVPYDVADPDKPRRMPRIQKSTLNVEKGTMTKPVDATPQELVPGIAGVAIFAASRGGAYYGRSAGFGVKWQVESIIVFPNVMRNQAPEIDMSAMEILEPEAEAPSAHDAPVAPGGEVLDSLDGQFEDGAATVEAPAPPVNA